MPIPVLVSILSLRAGSEKYTTLNSSKTTVFGPHSVPYGMWIVLTYPVKSWDDTLFVSKISNGEING